MPSFITFTHQHTCRYVQLNATNIHTLIALIVKPASEWYHNGVADPCNSKHRQRELNKSTAYIINGMRRERDVKEHNNEARCDAEKCGAPAHLTQYHRGDGCYENPVPLQQALHIPASPLFLPQHIHDRQAHRLHGKPSECGEACDLPLRGSVTERRWRMMWSCCWEGDVICCCFCLCQSLSTLLITSDRAFIAPWPLIYRHFVS